MTARMIIILILLSLFGCESKEKTTFKKEDLDTQSEKISYSLGIETGKKFRENEFDLDTEAFMAGVEDGMLDTTYLISKAQIKNHIDEYNKDMFEKLKSINKRKAEEFLERNKEKEDITETSSGLQYRIISEGYGIKPTINDTVVVQYEGYLLDGTLYDSSFKRGREQIFAVVDLIPGWREILPLMTEGDIYEIYIPPMLGYGAEGNNYLNIPPNSLLHVKLELVAVKNKPAARN